MQKNHYKIKNKGFTLIETMIAVFILTVALTGFFSVIASSLFSARYANNEITATYLLQEAIDSVRNDRDTAVQQSGGWANFQTKYSACVSSTDGCQIEPEASTSSITTCPSSGLPGNFGTIKCALFFYDKDAGTLNSSNKDFYTYQNPQANLPTMNFKRKLTMTVNPNNAQHDEIDVTATVEWENGSLVRSQSLTTSLLNWKQ